MSSQGNNSIRAPLDSPVDSGAVRDMFDRIAPTYDLLNTILSGGLHRIWERRIVRETTPGERCLDLCTGTGALVPGLARRFREVAAADISPQMLEVGRKRFRRLLNVSWTEADAQALPFADNSFDTVTVAYGVRNLPDPERGLREMLRVAREGGELLVLEFGQPTCTLWRKIFGWYSNRIIPLIGGMISGDSGAYRYLPKTSAVFPCGAAFEELLCKAGWNPIKTVQLAGGVAYIYHARRAINS